MYITLSLGCTLSISDNSLSIISWYLTPAVSIQLRNLFNGSSAFAPTLFTSVASLILYFITYFFDTGIVLTPFLLILASGIFGINTMLAGLQLKGRMSKERNKKKIKASVAIWVGITLLLLIFMVFILPGILVSVLGLGQPVA